MVTPGEGSTTSKTTTTTVLWSGPTPRLPSQEGETSNEETPGKQDVKRAANRVKLLKSKQHVFTQGLHCTQRFSCDSPVRFMMYSEAAAEFISLHSDNTVCIYKPDGHKQTSSHQLHFTGLTATKISGWLVGWGPGPVFTLLDRELRPLDSAQDALDVRICQAAEHSTELVTAGVGNVCVWSVRLMRCKMKIQEGLHDKAFTHMALAPPQLDRPHRAFVTCGQVLTVVNLDTGKVLEHKMNLCLGDISAIVFCSELDCLIVASEDLSINVWSPDWELRVAFVEQHGVMNSLFYSSELHMLLSASMHCKLCCWNIEDGKMIECINTEQKIPPVFLGGTTKGDIFFTFSDWGVDFWRLRKLYNLHCKLKEDDKAPLRQIVVSPVPAPYPVRVLCVSGDSNVTLVVAETGAVLTSFKANQRVLCADYCLHKEILLALTEAGTLLQANTLTNPVTVIHEWKAKGQGPWQKQDHVTASVAQKLPVPGPPCCLVLYSYVADTEETLEEWRSLQESRGCSSQRNKASLVDDKNKFLIILGQNGGCISALALHNGKVLYRTPAHSGQRVTTLQVYPENDCLLSTGEDLTVVVWKVNPYIQECLCQQLSLQCNQPRVYVAVLGAQLAVTFEKPNTSTFGLMHFNLHQQDDVLQPPQEGHLNHFTGLCACPDLDVFISSSLDGTVNIWNERNHLIRTLQLSTEPECLAYGGYGGELFLGVKGDLYKINCPEFLPHKYQEMLIYTYCAERLPDSPITAAEEESPAATSNQPMEECQRENMDLSALLQGTIKCRKGKPRSTKQTKSEAFDRYMKIIYGLPLSVKVDLEDTFDPAAFSFYHEPVDRDPCELPPLKEDVRSPSKPIIPVTKRKMLQEKKAPMRSCEPKTLMKVKPQPAEKETPTTPSVMVERDEAPPQIISPIEKQHKPRTPALVSLPPPLPPPAPWTLTPLPPRELTPEVPMFLKQFADSDWFRDLFSDKKSFPVSLSPEDFSSQLLGLLTSCSAASKLKILEALQILHSQGLLENTENIQQGLVDLVPEFVKPHMSSLERTVLVEMLNLSMRLKSAGYDLVKKLLALLAFKKLDLWEPVLLMLSALGVDEVGQWLWPELDSWDTELQDQSNIWKSLQDRADCWLQLWVSKYKEHSAAKRRPSSFKVVDVLNYFCSVQKQEHTKGRRAAPTGHNNTTLQPPHDRSFQPVLHLGETYSMSRTRKPPGMTLPPLRNRPSLLNFPNYICFPFSRITLRPFHTYTDDDWTKASPRRYFIPAQAHVEYYR